jgi:hypothetical protein
MEPEEIAKLIPQAVAAMHPAEKELMKRAIHRGADPAKESLKAVQIYLARQESARIRKERGLK